MLRYTTIDVRRTLHATSDYYRITHHDSLLCKEKVLERWKESLMHHFAVDIHVFGLQKTLCRSIHFLPYNNVHITIRYSKSHLRFSIYIYIYVCLVWFPKVYQKLDGRGIYVEYKHTCLSSFWYTCEMIIS